MVLKIGDKVRCIHSDKYRKLDGKFGTVVEVEGDIVGVEFDEEIDGHTLGGLARMGHGWYLLSYHLEYIGRNDAHTKIIIITVEGKTTLAKLMKGRVCVAEAKAKCSPYDAFDPLVGAQIALQRLVEQRGSKFVVNSKMFNDVEVI
jgi:hypothetical protein